MRKIICVAFLCLFANVGFAQSSFYASVQAGPSFSYSNSTEPFNYYHKKLTSIYGVGFGYEFPNQLIKAETGIYRTNIFSIFSLNGYTSNYGNDQIFMTRNSWQIPLRFKLKFWQPSEKITLRAISGVVLSLTPDNFKLQGDLINVSSSQIGTTFQTPSSAQQNTEFFTYWNIGRRNRMVSVDSNFLIESGVELGYTLTVALSGFLGIVYQGGLQTKYGGIIYQGYIDPVNGQPTNYFPLYASSKANALSLNFGLTYAFGK